MARKENIEKLDNLEISIIIVIIIVVIISLLAPIVFTPNQWSIVDFTRTGQIGDTIGGIMTPIIAIAGVLVTFLAFYIQFKANKLQRNLFREELDDQKEQAKTTKFENQFYEMLRLHKENVNELFLNLKAEDFSGRIEYTHIKGRDVFKYFVEEMKVLYYVAKKIYPNETPDSILNRAYGIFFHGLSSFNGDSYNSDTYLKSLENIRWSFISNPLIYKNYVNNDIEKINHSILKYKLFEGYSSILAHYYRHLYQTVKFVVTQNEELLTYEQKRNYLRILRVQLSNQEQVVLFYNWRSNFGFNWENHTNKYFTDYRMIHNIYNDIIIKDFDLENIFRLDNNVYYKTERERDWDPLFEFQDWKIRDKL